ncbi:MAG TPA: ABC transporter permease [Acidimicrobiia bacterium]|nr:ABC transporter permease [Acidimicrobiia bacterium]
MNRTRIAAVIRRHWLVLWRSPHRWFEIAFWPVMDVVLWGSLGVFIAQENQASRAGVPYLLAGLILFWTLTQVQMTGSVSIMEETWTRNLLNVLTTSVTPFEYLLGVSVFGLAKLALTLGTLTITTVSLYGFDLTAIGWSVIPIVLLLVLNGWALAFVIIGLILRFGQSAEILTWGLNYVVLSISGVFFPIEALPPGLRQLAGLLPTTHAFAAARSVLDGDGVPWGRLRLSTLGTAVALALSAWFGTRMLGVFRSRGFVTRYS